MTPTKITEEALNDLRKRMHQWRTLRPWYEFANKDAIRHHAMGIGDANRLWCDEEYATKTRWGGIIASPIFLYTYNRGEIGGLLSVGLPGVAAVWTGDDWEWFQPIRLDARLTAKTAFVDLIEKTSAHAGRAFDQVRETVYLDESGRLVARMRMISKRFDRQPSKKEAGEKRYEDWTRYRYSEEELKAIDESYRREVVRGADPRWWEDVNVGDELTPVTKGPLTVTEEVAWYAGAGAPLGFASRIRWDFFQRHPSGNVPDPVTNVPDVTERIHWDTEAAKVWGVPDFFDVGPQRVSWLCHLMTNWMGDDGFLRKLGMQARRFNLAGDTCWCKGKVSRKYVANGEHLVDCDLIIVNQRGEEISPGHATVSLPSREGGPVALPQAPIFAE
ncbi:MAG: MaoC family dehydratase N-terminal domain-containing protein [Chloroflexi bacterium]|nr:MaoC family dehydratase N-terminal domain-containing protein [Chloroflexota bacterium]